MFICQSVKSINPKTVGNATKANWVYYKPVANGFIFVLKYKHTSTVDCRKQHTTVNNLIERLDTTLKLAARTEVTSFLSINDDPTLKGSKVLSFEKDGRQENPLYRQLFGANGSILPNIQVWDKEIAAAAELSYEDDQTYTSDDEPTLNEGDGEGSGAMIASENVGIALIYHASTLF